MTKNINTQAMSSTTSSSDTPKYKRKRRKKKKKKSSKKKASKPTNVIVIPTNGKSNWNNLKQKLKPKNKTHWIAQIYHENRVDNEPSSNENHHQSQELSVKSKPNFSTTRDQQHEKHGHRDTIAEHSHKLAFWIDDATAGREHPVV